MLFNGERIGDGCRAVGRHRRRPARGHDADRARHAERAVGDRALAARHDVRPGPVRVHGEDRRRRRRSPTCSTSTARSARRSALIAERKGIAVADVMVVMLDRPRHARGARRDPRGRRARAPDQRRRRLGGAAGLRRGRARSTCCGASAARPRACISAAAIKCIGGQLLGRLWPRDDAERQAAIDAGYDLDARARRRRPRRRRRLLLLGDRRHRRRRAPGRALPGRDRRHDRVAGDALALGHRAAHPRAPRPRRSCAATRTPPLTRAQLPRRKRPGARLREIEARERAQEAVRDEHVDRRLRRRVEAGCRARWRSPGRS